MACNFLMGCHFAGPLPHKIRQEMIPLFLFCSELKKLNKKKNHKKTHPLNSQARFLEHFSFSNFRMGFLLNQSGHLHSHSHSHPHSHVPQSNSPSTARSSGHGHSSLAVRAAFVHALGDLVQSIGVLVAAYIIRFKVRNG